MSDPFQLWSYLAQEPLLWLTVTLAAYVIADWTSDRLGRHPVANPVLIAILIIAAVLGVSDTLFETYFDGAQFVHFMLGPATVAMAVPLHANLGRVKRVLAPMAVALVAGSLTAIASALGIAYALGLRGEALLSLAPKSATAPVALGVSEAIGGEPTLTAVLVILTGITGAIVATPLLNALRIEDWRARGFAVGLAAHGIGTAHAFRVNSTAGAFSGIGMGLNALLTAVLAPLVVTLLL